MDTDFDHVSKPRNDLSTYRLKEGKIGGANFTAPDEHRPVFDRKRPIRNRWNRGKPSNDVRRSTAAMNRGTPLEGETAI